MDHKDNKLIKGLIKALTDKPDFDEAGELADKLEQHHANDITNVWISMLIDDLSSQNQAKAQQDLKTIKTKLTK